MKKVTFLSLAVATAIALGGCGDKQQPMSENDLETISEKQVEQALNSLADRKTKRL